jgi:hypothetical protein
MILLLVVLAIGLTLVQLWIERRPRESISHEAAANAPQV